MKKFILYTVAILSAFTFYSCCDDEGIGANVPDQMFMTQFRKNHNTGFDKDGDKHSEYYCQPVGKNSVILSWYLVNGAAGYEIKWAETINVSNGQEAWDKTEAEGNLIGDTIISDPQQFSLLLKDLPYGKIIRFAIRTLHSLDKNDPKNSKWYGYGNGREWADYYETTTLKRFEEVEPQVLSIPYDETDMYSMTVKLDRSINGYTEEELKMLQEVGVVIENGHFKVDYLTFNVSESTPDAIAPKEYEHYDIPESAWVDDKAEIKIEGLSQNSYYSVDVWNNDWMTGKIAKIDGSFNSLLKHTKGQAGAPITIAHMPQAKDTIGSNVYDISQYNSCKLDSIIVNYCKSTTLSENQVFYLEGGKAYHFSGNCEIYKGLTLRTKPEDVANGKRATLYLSGMTKTGGVVNTCNFMIGRQPRNGENSSITLDIDSVRFMDLDVQVPMACNIGHQTEGLGNVCGNYFMNMYSNGMGINVTLLEWDNCTFQGLIRGFFRVQGANDFYINNIKLKNCQFYNNGFYATTGGDYGYIYADMNGKKKSCILKNVEVYNNVFYDCPKSSLVTDANRDLVWDSSVKWNVDVHHNTFVNWNSQGKQSIINTRFIPGGSKLAFHENLIILTRDEHDVNRLLDENSVGWDARNIQGGDGSNHAYFIIYDNYSTNDYLTNGQVFSASAFSATSNAPGKWVKGWKTEGTFEKYFPYGEAGLVVTADDIHATELMVDPNPKNFIGATAKHNDHHTDTGIQGLFYQQTDKVRNSQIYKKRVGAPMLIR